MYTLFIWGGFTGHINNLMVNFAFYIHTNTHTHYTYTKFTSHFCFQTEKVSKGDSVRFSKRLGTFSLVPKVNPHTYRQLNRTIFQKTAPKLH